MEKINEIQKLMKKEKSLKKAILTLTERLYSVQNILSDLTLKEIKKNQPKDTSKDELMTNSEVCKLLNISSSTLYRMRVYNGFPSVKIEGRKNVMYKKSDINNYMKLYEK
jgi:excisionase family DNA binding protein